MEKVKLSCFVNGRAVAFDIINGMVVVVTVVDNADAFVKFPFVIDIEASKFNISDTVLF